MFEIHNVRLENVTITDGESGIKHCSDIEADNCRFYGKYPWCTCREASSHAATSLRSQDRQSGIRIT